MFEQNYEKLDGCALAPLALRFTQRLKTSSAQTRYCFRL